MSPLFPATVLCACAAVTFWLGCSREAPQPPNVLLYLVDTLRADGLATYGNPVVETPTIDAIGAEGAVFENAFAQSSWTRASVASILTAHQPAAHGVEGRNAALAAQATLLSERMQAAGYRTAFITTNPNVGSFFGFDQGFDDFIELYERRASGWVQPRELVTGADEVVDTAKRWLDGASEPFLLVVLAIDPHGPYIPPDEFDRYGGDYDGPANGRRKWIDRHDLSPADRQRIRSLYYGEIAFTDSALGTLVEHLRSAGRYDRTVVVFSSDHGEEFWEHGRRGHGKNLVDEATHVPLLVRYPPRIAPGTRISEVVQTVDIAPTVLDLAGLAIPDDLDGRALLAAGPSPGEAYASLDLDGNTPLSALRSGDWKLVVNDATGERQLFDMASSGGEHVDRGDERPEIRERLARRLAAHRALSRRRFVATFGETEALQVDPGDVSDAERALLRELGYLHDVDVEANGDEPGDPERAE